jgi:hypothetical protein
MFMKLFLVHTVCDSGEYSELVVAETDIIAEEQVAERLRDNGEIVYVARAREVSEVDGHKIVLIKEGNQ